MHILLNCTGVLGYFSTVKALCQNLTKSFLQQSGDGVLWMQKLKSALRRTQNYDSFFSFGKAWSRSEYSLLSHMLCLQLGILPLGSFHFIKNVLQLSSKRFIKTMCIVTAYNKELFLQGSITFIFPEGSYKRFIQFWCAVAVNNTLTRRVVEFALLLSYYLCG